MAAAGAFDDVVFRYKLKGQSDCRTCFIQLKHKENDKDEEKILPRPKLKTFSGDFSLLKYFGSYCQIKREVCTHHNLKLCGSFENFEFIIYTNARLDSQQSEVNDNGVDTNLASILSSRPNNGLYTSFDENRDKDIFDFFEELSRYYNFLLGLEYMLYRGAYVDRVRQEIRNIRWRFTSAEILQKLEDLERKGKVQLREQKKELEKYHFSLYKEFLQKVKIFHSQSNVHSTNDLIKKELQEACHTSPTGTESIYKKIVDHVTEWWGERVSAEWLSERSVIWQNVKQCLIEKIRTESKLEFQESLCFKESHIQSLSDVLQRSCLLNVITTTNGGPLSKLKIYQSLNSLCYRDSLFISLKALMKRREQILEFWPCKWSSVLVVDCEQGPDDFDNNLVDIISGMLLHSEKKIAVISQRKHQNLASGFQKKLRDNYASYEDDCNLLHLDDKSQQHILKRTVDFQGTEIPLEELIGKYPPESIKQLIDSDVLSLLLGGKKKLRIGRKLSDLPSYYVPRILEHRVYLNDDILRRADDTITFAITGLEPSELKRYIPVDEKIHKLEFDERSRTCRFNIVDSFTESGLSVDLRSKTTRLTVSQSSVPQRARYIILGKKDPETDFKGLKVSCKNVHWIDMKDGKFVWRESNCSIHMIRKYIDNTKCEPYDDRRIIEHSDTAMLLTAEPGMGKSTLLSYMEHEIKKRNPATWLVRINLSEYTETLKDTEFEREFIEKCKEFLWNAAHSPEENALELVNVIFLQALEQTENVVVILDGFDEVSKYYSHHVEMLIKTIMSKMRLKIWVASRFSDRVKLEDIMMKFAFTLRPFNKENQIAFLEQYWNSKIKGLEQKRLRMFAEVLLRLSAKNFSDRDGQFTGIPLQTMMLGEAFSKEAESYCVLGAKVNLPENFNLLALFRKFTYKKCDIYFSEKSGIDMSKTIGINIRNACIEKHIDAALMSLFSLD
jgi:hypothetical protein